MPNTGSQDVAGTPVRCKKLCVTTYVVLDGGGRSDAFRAKVVLAEFDPGIATPALDALLKLRDRAGESDKLTVEDGACLDDALLKTEEEVMSALRGASVNTDPDYGLDEEDEEV